MSRYIPSEELNYSVYWIHLPEHTDIKTEGYVGITSDVTTRFARHKTNSEANLQRCKHLENALAKHDNVIFDVIMTGCCEELASFVELELRPTSSIGWNIATGGNITKLFGENNPNFGKVWTDHEREALSKTCKERLHSVGVKNPNHDNTIYTLQHPEHGVEKLTKYEFKNKYGFDLKPLFRSKSPSKIRKGWSLI